MLVRGGPRWDVARPVSPRHVPANQGELDMRNRADLIYVHVSGCQRWVYAVRWIHRVRTSGILAMLNSLPFLPLFPFSTSSGGDPDHTSSDGKYCLKTFSGLWGFISAGKRDSALPIFGPGLPVSSELPPSMTSERVVEHSFGLS